MLVEMGGGGIRGILGHCAPGELEVGAIEVHGAIDDVARGVRDPHGVLPHGVIRLRDHPEARDGLHVGVQICERRLAATVGVDVTVADQIPGLLVDCEPAPHVGDGQTDRQKIEDPRRRLGHAASVDVTGGVGGQQSAGILEDADVGIRDEDPVALDDGWKKRRDVADVEEDLLIVGDPDIDVGNRHHGVDAGAEALVVAHGQIGPEDP